MAGNIPEESSSFVGRGSELAAVVGASKRFRLVTLTGIGGVGKTRLARRAAEIAGAEYADGAWWADLSPLYGERLLLATVSDAVGLTDHTPRMPVAALCEHLGDKRLLLVLDSCEHLVDAVRTMLADLLTAAPELTVLVTSRQPLGVPGEQVVDVGPLPDHGDNEALRLFLDRAATAAPDLELSGQRALALAVDISGRLEGIPLALELAGAQLRHLSLEELADRLDSRLDLLQGEPWGWEPRHRALRTAIGWSHELCAPRERLLWARLSVFQGAFDAATARAVCSDARLSPKDVDRALDALVDKSVVGRDGPQHRMLDTLREYGRMWLDELGERSALRSRHAEHHLRLVREADAGWLSHRQVDWYRAVAQRHADVCAALEHLLLDAPDRALELAGKVSFFWACCGHLHESRGFLERALAASAAPGPDRTRTLWGLGVTAMLQGDMDRALLLGVECTGAAEVDGDPRGRFDAAYLLGLTRLMHGDTAAGRATVDAALDAFPGSPLDSASRLRCQLVRVFALTALGDLDEACEEAADLRLRCAHLGETWTYSYLEYQLSLIALHRGRTREAVAHARGMLMVKRLLGDSFGVALGLDVLAAALAADGDPSHAAFVYGTGLACWRTVGHPQRGTPELGAVRAAFERTARDALGDGAYAAALREGTQADPVPSLESILTRGPRRGD